MKIFNTFCISTAWTAKDIEAKDGVNKAFKRSISSVMYKENSPHNHAAAARTYVYMYIYHESLGMCVIRVI